MSFPTSVSSSVPASVHAHPVDSAPTHGKKAPPCGKGARCSCSECSRLSPPDLPPVQVSRHDEAKMLHAVTTKFTTAFQNLIQKYLQQTRVQYGMPAELVDRLEQMILYTCSGGKMYRGRLAVMTAYKVCTKRGDDFSARLDQAIGLGWCIEILQSCFLVADDIMDNSTTRRGKACWFRRPEVGMDAVNDTFILESMVYFILRELFGSQPSVYMSLVDLFREITNQTQMGQMLDIMCESRHYTRSEGKSRLPPEPARHVLDLFTADRYRKIMHYKTAFYTFYLPVAAGMIMCGEAATEQLQAAREVSAALGEKFQIQDDFLDCYGDPAETGKEGTDIQVHKCTWLIVTALSLANQDQLDILKNNYGQSAPSSIDAVKSVYDELDLPWRYEQTQQRLSKRIQNLISQHQHTVPPSVFLGILKKIDGRSR